ncbi:hypothetical protein SCP_0313480 [Sparassis crispa]|uniref:CigA protein n=1 Tax=Sparassis crispa TaxID=139825 RepID=A0A401GHH1_9APHY|nr:hypothetical protein SCP_0313480 [Sparassis crispa]GBE81619.1 hypothetical protein SCP_0313480 [Sparassis crispa]
MAFYNVSVAARLAAQASPSVSVEKGTYRMCMPSRRTPSKLRRRPRDTPATTIEKQMALLVVFLVCATITCFGTAYYLFTTRWDTWALRSSLVDGSDAVLLPQVDVISSDTSSLLVSLPGIVKSVLGSVSEEDERPVDGERYLGYLPHSGFHNQRIAFENALVLSRLLNRTLLVPPVRLSSKPLTYQPFNVLHEVLVNDTKIGHERCGQPQLDDEWAQRCAAYAEYTHVPWDWLIDLTPIKQEQRLLQHWNFTDAWLSDNLKIAANDTFALRDTNRTDYSFQDFTTFKSTLGRKYQHALHLSTLAHRPERLLQLGTLFGSSRLHLRDRGNVRVRSDVRKTMAFANPHLMAVADAIRDKLGGTYLGAHVRLGDGFFLDRGEASVRLVWWKLLYALAFTTEEISSLERWLVLNHTKSEHEDLNNLAPPYIPPDTPSLRVPHPSLPALPIPPQSSKLVCSTTMHTSAVSNPSRLDLLNTPLFLATDAATPRNSTLLERFTRTFPCTFFLEDFPVQTSVLDSLHGTRDGVALRQFVLPFLEAMVASRAWDVVGTEGSTFSSFVKDVLWRTYHGWEIVQRG